MLEWPFFEDRHREFAAFARRAPAGRGRGATSTRAAAAFVRALARDGWLEHASASRSTCARSASRARRSPATTALADFAFAMQGLGSGPISLFGTDEQRARVPAGGRRRREDRGVRAVGARRGLGRGGDDHDRATATALTGTKTWISNGGIADFYTVFARAPEGISAYIVEADGRRDRRAHRRDRAAPAGHARVRRRARRS